ncbi:MAG: hypothetical protein COC24_003240 [Alphaproteobacteria bacterium]|nr:hypothetical protein [Alphaproteobacteria bacterium]
MTNYILAFHGGNQPSTPEEGKAIMAKWEVWMTKLGDAIVSPGSPLGQSSTVLASGNVEANGGSNPLSGFTIIQATNLQAALKLTNDCPILESQGTIEVAEMVSM